MTSRKADKKLDLKVRRVLKTNVRGGIKEIVAAVGPGAVAASGDDAASYVGPGPRGPSYGSRMPTSDAGMPISPIQISGAKFSG
jgi:hypothetical protein